MKRSNRLILLIGVFFAIVALVSEAVRRPRAAPVVGRRLYKNLVQEEQRLSQGWTYEPPTFYETNFAGGPPGSVCIDPIGIDPRNH
mgnify:CR=1 FL=1